MKLAAGIRPLYLLALFQLFAGPLVLFCVMILCRETVREAADHGVATAVSMAWKCPDFRAALATADHCDLSKKETPHRGPQEDPVKVEMPPIAWQATPVVLVNDRKRPKILPLPIRR